MKNNCGSNNSGIPQLWRTGAGGTEVSGAKSLGLLRLLWLLKSLRPLVLLTLLGVVGCSKDEGNADTAVKEPEEGLAIAFGGQVQEEQTVTRAATSLSGKGVTAFTVYGYKNTGTDEEPYSTCQTVFPGYVVKWTANSAGTSTTNNHDWEYVGQEYAGQPTQTVKFWDYSAKAYRFFGVTGPFVNHTVSEESVPDGAGGTYEVRKISFDVDATTDEGIAAVSYYSHLWFSTGNIGEGYAPFGNAVQLEFVKPLARVRFMFIFEDPADAAETDLTDTNFHPTSGTTIKQSGRVHVAYPITGNITTETMTLDTSDGSGLAGFKQAEKVYTVIPVTNQGTYTLTVNVDGDTKNAVVPATYMDWKAGYEYTYIFKVHVDKGVTIDAVQSAFKEWEEKTDDRTVYNW